MTSGPGSSPRPQRLGPSPDPTRRRLLATLGLGAGVAGVTTIGAPLRARTPAHAADPPSATSATVDLDTVSGRLTDRSMGFSFERNTLALPLFDDANTDLVALFRLLGRGVLRLGGNSVDRTEWDHAGGGRTPAIVSPPDLVRLRRFLDATGWRAIYGTPFLSAGASPDSVADEVTVASTTLGARLDGVELCNEPDLYALDPTTKALAGTLASFNDRWDRFATAVRAAAPEVAIVGPSDCLLQTIAGFAVPFTTAHAGELSQVTQHYYRGFGGPQQTIDLLLSPDPLVPGALETLATTAASAGAAGFRIGETNSFASGGQPGVSNSFAAALWAADWFGTATGAGALGLDFHNSGTGAGYPAIVQVGGTVTEVRPLFAGLLAAASLGTGPMRPVAIDDAGATLRAHACSTSSTQVRLLVLNLGNDDRTVSVDLATGVDRATSVALAGPALDATAGVTFAGAAVAIDASWDRQPPTELEVSGSIVNVPVHAGSAALVTIDHQPKAPSPPPPPGPTTSMSGSTVADAPTATPRPVQPRYVG
jgi:hypothetical protein